MKSFIVDEIATLLREPRTAQELFAKVSYEDLLCAVHPDRNPGDQRAAVLFERVRQLYEHRNDPPLTVTSPKRTYTLLRLLAVGDVADIHLARATPEPAGAPESSYLLKIARIPEGHTLFGNERRTLTHLLTQAGDTTYRKYLPTLAESFPAKAGFQKRVNVFLYEPDFFTLEQVHEQHPQLDGRHLAWIFKRLLTILGFSHGQHKVHGAVLPNHVMVNPANHGLQLVGWGQSVDTGQWLKHVSTRYQDWYPPEVATRRPVSASTDVFLAARCLVYLAGGDPLGDRMPAHVPDPLQRFVRSCLLEGPSMRPDDAWKLLDEWDEMLQQLYGPPQFHQLTIT